MQEIELINQIIAMQENKLLNLGRFFVPQLTSEDILQPFDYPELEENVHFRFEEGVLQGMHTVRSALLALKKEQM